MTRLTVDGNSERWLRKGFCWVYPKEITRGRAAPGTVVEVESRQGEVLGTGIADDGWIAVRVFRRGAGPVDEALVRARMAEALAWRREVVDAGTSAWRWVHGENDGLPGIRVDRWGPVAAVVLDTPAVASLVPFVLRCLEEDGVTGVVGATRPDARDAGRHDQPASRLAGTVPDEVEVTERGLRFGIRPMEAPDVGLYTDLRELRAWLAPHWRGRRVINTFAFTGAFGVAAEAGGATEIVSVDLSKGALARAEANVVRNGGELSRHQFVVGDTFRALDAERRAGRKADLIVLDPPSFSRSDLGVWSAQRDWPRLVAAAARVAAPGAWLVCVSNQGELSPHPWHGMLLDGVARAERGGRWVHFGGQAPDVPAGLHVPEGRYLKTAVIALDGSSARNSSTTAVG